MSKVNLTLQFLLPPPGLGRITDVKVVVDRTCASRPRARLDACGACDDHGHPVTSGKSAKKEKGVKVFWELFSGDGNLSKAMANFGFAVVEPIDVKHDPTMDLTHRQLQDCVRQFILDGHVDYFHLGTPCTVFSRARRGIKNHAKARHKERIGCELAFFSCELARLCNQHGIAWSIENPQTSRIWELECFREILALPGVVVVDFPMCNFGQPYKKPTRIITNCQMLAQLRGSCPHHKHAEVLKSRTWSPIHGWSNRTTLAGSYPKALCNRWARAVREDPDVRSHDKKESRPNFGQFLQTCRSEPAASKHCSKQEQFPITSAIPDLLDQVVFGQHSKAEIAHRKARKFRTNKGSKKAQTA